jgi:hypothetical protein
MGWELFTKRTNDPKLAWLENQLDLAEIPHRRNGESFHAPILEIPAECYEHAWAILTPVDEIPDNDPQFCQGGPGCDCYDCETDREDPQDPDRQTWDPSPFGGAL